MTNLVSVPRGVPNVTNERVAFPINGMWCPLCAQRAEKRLAGMVGVRRARVNFANAQAKVQYDPHDVGVLDLMAEIKRTGYETAGSANADFVVSDSTYAPDYGVQLVEFLMRLPGVVKVDADLVTGKVRVEYLADRINLAMIRNAITLFGHQNLFSLF
jgi:copper chaperone CopZ